MTSSFQNIMVWLTSENGTKSSKTAARTEMNLNAISSTIQMMVSLHNFSNKNVTLIYKFVPYWNWFWNIPSELKIFACNFVHIVHFLGPWLWFQNFKIRLIMPWPCSPFSCLTVTVPNYCDDVNVSYIFCRM